MLLPKEYYDYFKREKIPVEERKAAIQAAVKKLRDELDRRLREEGLHDDPFPETGTYGDFIGDEPIEKPQGIIGIRGFFSVGKNKDEGEAAVEIDVVGFANVQLIVSGKFRPDVAERARKAIAVHGDDDYDVVPWNDADNLR